MQHSLEWTAGGIGLHVNVEKAEYMCFLQRGDISTLKGGPLKIVDNFTYLGSSVWLTDKDIKMRLAKAWTAIDRQWKSDMINKTKRSFFQAAVVSILLYECTPWTKRIERKFDGNYTKILQAVLNKYWR